MSYTPGTNRATRRIDAYVYTVSEKQAASCDYYSTGFYISSKIN